MERKRKTETLVTRLRKPLMVDERSNTMLTFIVACEKLDAIGEALAYLIEKKHAKLKTKKMSKKTPLK